MRLAALLSGLPDGSRPQCNIKRPLFDSASDPAAGQHTHIIASANGLLQECKSLCNDAFSSPAKSSHSHPPQDNPKPADAVNQAQSDHAVHSHVKLQGWRSAQATLACTGTSSNISAGSSTGAQYSRPADGPVCHRNSQTTVLLCTGQGCSCQLIDDREAAVATSPVPDTAQQCRSHGSTVAASLPQSDRSSSTTTGRIMRLQVNDEAQALPDGSADSTMHRGGSSCTVSTPATPQLCQLCSAHACSATALTAHGAKVGPTVAWQQLQCAVSWFLQLLLLLGMLAATGNGMLALWPMYQDDLDDHQCETAWQ
eukprot:jgi/Chrzof1/3989/Cz13g16080.t1